MDTTGRIEKVSIIVSKGSLEGLVSITSPGDGLRHDLDTANHTFADSGMRVIAIADKFDACDVETCEQRGAMGDGVAGELQRCGPRVDDVFVGNEHSSANAGAEVRLE